jgi:hypothetical protein
MRAASVLKLRKPIQLSRSDERLEIVMHGSSGQSRGGSKSLRAVNRAVDSIPNGVGVIGHTKLRAGKVKSALRGGHCQVAELNAHQFVEAQCVEAPMLCRIVSASIRHRLFAPHV